MVPTETARKLTGKFPITVRWVHTNNGDDIVPNMRARLVAREIRHNGDEAIFAPTPPLETLRTVLSLAVTQLPGQPARCRDPESEDRVQISLVDISRAYFNAKIDQRYHTFVESPQSIHKPEKVFADDCYATCTARGMPRKGGRMNTHRLYLHLVSPKGWRALASSTTMGGFCIRQSTEITSQQLVPRRS